MAIEFTNKPTKWENDGAEPSTELKKNGFQAGYKPPAGIFNHQWHTTGKCIDELQTEVSSIDDKKANSSDVLKKTNTAAFTPTADYHPATKKYVDDNKIDIIDDLNTMSNVAALSAYQGKVLKDKITALPIKSLAGQTVATFKPSNEPITTVTAGDGATIIGDTRERTFGTSINTALSSYAIKSGNIATGEYSTAIGLINTATGKYALAGGISSWADGNHTLAFGNNAISKGVNGATALGYHVKSTGGYGSVAIGYFANATGASSIAIGNGATASGGSSSVAIGTDANATGAISVAMGYKNNALDCQFKIGQYAKDGELGALGGTSGDAFIIGNGNDTDRSNAFRVTYAGKAYGLSAYGSSGADYAEYFEWKDGNPNNEDRRGKLVTLDGEKIRLATADDDYILGVVSANPCIEGDVYSDDWQGKYLTDVFGQRLTQTVHIPARYEEQEITDPETGETTTENVLIEDEHDAVQWVLNPDYDPEQEYVSREDRKEWTSIGLMGKLVVIDDGTCEINGYCKAGVNGIATKADDGYRVMARIDDTHIRVLVR